MLVIARGGLVDQRGVLLVIVGAVGVARRVLSDEQRVADDGVLLRFDDGGEDAVQGVIISRRNRIKLMVVAAGARDG